jgi:hypothetical protein
LESNWRWGVEEYGLGGPILGVLGRLYHWKFAVRLNPPLVIAGTTYTHVAFMRRPGFPSFLMYGALSSGTVFWGPTDLVPEADRFPLGLGVDPDGIGVIP